MATPDLPNGNSLRRCRWQRTACKHGREAMRKRETESDLRNEVTPAHCDGLEDPEPILQIVAGHKGSNATVIFDARPKSGLKQMGAKNSQNHDKKQSGNPVVRCVSP